MKWSEVAAYAVGALMVVAVVVNLRGCSERQSEVSSQRSVQEAKIEADKELALQRSLILAARGKP